MRNGLVYDLPTRLFHWIFAGLFATAYLIASTAEDSAVFPWHMLAGLTLCLAVLLRLLWGVIGTRHARFASFPLSPLALLRYLKGLVTGGQSPVAGHNPASSWVAITLMGLGLGLGATGYLMTSSGNAESWEEVHELLANTFLAIVLLHIAGVALHALRHRDGFALSMVDGRKQQVDPAERIAGARPAMGMLFIAIVAAFAVYLGRHYDAGTQSLNLFGTVLQLGESEGGDEQESRGTGQQAEEGHGDDD
jgi:cytochrome b